MSGRSCRPTGSVLLRALVVATAILPMTVGASPADEHVNARLSRIRIPFVANAGQTDPAVAYYAPTFAGTVFVTRVGAIVYALPRTKRNASSRGTIDLIEKPVGGVARPSAGNPAATRVSYFIGNQSERWKHSLPAFENISFGRVWPGIDVELEANGRNVEKRFTVEPDGDASRIRMRVVGAKRLWIDAAGELVAATNGGNVVFTRPDAFQQRAGIRRSIAVAYELRGRDEYGFRIGDHDPRLPLTIDPLLQSTYIGGGGIDSAFGIAIHPTSGEVYVAGASASATLPDTSGGAQSAHGGKTDAFVARLNAALTTLEQVTYLGGVEDDHANAIAIHPTSGDIYVAGQTTSTDFPGTAGGAQSTNGTFSTAAFVAHLNAALTTLDQSTYFAGGVTVAYALAIDPTTGNVYAAGSTIFSIIPGTTGAAQTESGGAVDGFIARFNAALTTLDRATYLGGGGGETAHGLAINPSSHNVYAVGDTSSTNFPGTAGGAQATHGVDFGNSDAFLAELDAGLTSIVQATYLGGNNQETANAIAIHATTGDVYVAGYTESTNFPGTSGGAQPTFTGVDAVFVAHLNAALTTLDQSTYLGIGGANRAFAIAIHPSSNDIYVAGYTTGDFPGTLGGAQSTFGGFQDGFVARLDATLTTLDQATCLGGTGADMAEAIAIHPTTGQVYVAGLTQSSNFPGTAGGAQAAHAADSNNNDAFVARLTPDLTATGGGNANLSGLGISAGMLSPAFAGSTFAYIDAVPFGIESVTVTPTLADGTSSVTVNGNAVASGSPSSPIDLSIGSNEIDVVVTAQGGSTKTYTIDVERAAALFRAYLSSVGNDANPCTLAKPCRLLPAALLAIDDGSEIWMLDSANYNTAPVDIAKSVTILAVPGAVGSVVASGGDAIDIAAFGIRVTLRNLVLLNLGGGVNGIAFSQGAALTVEACEIYGMGGSAIDATAASGNVAVSNSVLRDAASYGVRIAGAVTATLDSVQILGNALAGLFVGGNADVTLSNSVDANNATFGVTVQASAGTTVRVAVEKSVLRANVGGGVEGFADSGAAKAQIAIGRSSIDHNGSGVTAATNAGGTVTVVLSGDSITGNGTGVAASGAGSGIIYSRQNNTVSGNATDVSGVALTPLPGK